MYCSPIERQDRKCHLNKPSSNLFSWIENINSSTRMCEVPPGQQKDDPHLSDFDSWGDIEIPLASLRLKNEAEQLLGCLAWVLCGNLKAVGGSMANRSKDKRVLCLL